jgi:DNA-binding Lrp family transcriptional regulator
VLHACVLALVESGHVLDVVSEIRQMTNVGIVQATTGPFDLFVIVRALTPNDLANIIVNQIQGVQGVKTTLTLVVIEDEVELVHWLGKGANINSVQ